MGTMYALRCPDCNYMKMYQSGRGMFYDPTFGRLPLPTRNVDGLERRPRRRRSLPEQVEAGYFGAEVRKLAAAHRNDHLDFREDEGYRTPFYCPTCQKVTMRRPKTMSWRTGEESYEEYTIPQRCFTCKSALLSPERGGFEVKCPKCCSLHAWIGGVGMWD